MFNMPIKKVIKYVEDQGIVSLTELEEFIKKTWKNEGTQKQQLYRAKKCPLFISSKDGFCIKEREKVAV